MINAIHATGEYVLRSSPAVTHIALGEGEETIVEGAEWLDGKCKLEDVGGIQYLEGNLKSVLSAVAFAMLTNCLGPLGTCSISNPISAWAKVTAFSADAACRSSPREDVRISVRSARVRSCGRRAASSARSPTVLQVSVQHDCSIARDMIESCRQGSLVPEIARKRDRQDRLSFRAVSSSVAKVRIGAAVVYKNKFMGAAREAFV